MFDTGRLPQLQDPSSSIEPDGTQGSFQLLQIDCTKVQVLGLDKGIATRSKDATRGLLAVLLGAIGRY